ncbi:MAG: hypothetical protein ACK5JH_15075 [Anaerocolumna sp.]
MNGVKEFVNNTCSEINVTIKVRSGNTPGCTYRIEEFCLKVFECKKVCFGNEANPHLDGICVCYCTLGQCASSELSVIKCGSEVDRLLNQNYRILFLNAGPSVVISATKH